MYIIANWKMYLDYHHTLNYIKELNATKMTAQIQCIICPSFEALASAHSMLPAGMFLGAQDCSMHERGAYTGQIAAQSLAQTGCTYCIIGHNETRLLARQTNEQIYQKAEQLWNNTITPIVCIGETLEEFNDSKTEAALDQQLAFFSQNVSSKKIFVAYEPVWSIGTGKIPTKEQLTKTVESIKKSFKKELPPLLYGGSVTPESIDFLLNLELFDGFLIGKASIDYQQFTAIIQKVTAQF